MKAELGGGNWGFQGGVKTENRFGLGKPRSDFHRYVRKI